MSSTIHRQAQQQTTTRTTTKTMPQPHTEPFIIFGPDTAINATQSDDNGHDQRRNQQRQQQVKSHMKICMLL